MPSARAVHMYIEWLSMMLDYMVSDLCVIFPILTKRSELFYKIKVAHLWAHHFLFNDVAHLKAIGY